MYSNPDIVGNAGMTMKSQNLHSLPKTELLRQALEMLAIGNVAVHRAQARNRARGIPNYYSIGGRIVSDGVQPVSGGGHDD